MWTPPINESAELKSGGPLVNSLLCRLDPNPDSAKIHDSDPSSDLFAALEYLTQLCSVSTYVRYEKN